MSSSDSHDDPSPESGPVFSRETMTPRGGFMARPGLKPPPRHAVVVRGGDAPVAEAIPVARSSFPPPAPSEPPPISMSEKATLRAIPAARVPRISTVVFDEPPVTPRASEPPASHVALESAPPPSDSPLVQSIPPASSEPHSRRRGSGWTIVAAGAAGLILGLVSVLATRGGSESAAAASLAAAAPVVEAQPVATVLPAKVTTTVTPSTSAEPPSSVKARVETAAPKPAAATVKKSIF